MDLVLKKSKETNMLQHLANLLLVSKIPATYIETGKDKDELVHAVYLNGENSPKMSTDYYFEKDDNFKDHIFVCNRTVVPNVKSFNKDLDEDTILELLEAYNYLISDGSFVLDGNDINYRCVTIIDEDLPNEAIDFQMTKMISKEIAISEEVGKSFVNIVKGE